MAEQKPVTREELAEALRLVVKRGTFVQQSDQYMFEVLNTCRSILSRLDAEQSGVEEKHCELFTTKPSIPRDCQGDGHYECRNCGLLDPDSLMNRERTGPE